MKCFIMIVPLKSLEEKVAFTVISIITILFSVPGNAIVVYLTVKRPCLHLPTPVLVCSLALCDVLIAIAGQLPFTITIVFMHEIISCEADKITGFFHLMSCSSSLFILCLIARDRYLHVSTGLNYNEHTNTKQAITSAIICWIASMVLAGVYLVEEPYIKLIGTLSFSLVAMFGMAYICVKCKKILSIVSAHNVVMHSISANVDANATVNRSIIAVISLYSICWMPVTIIMVIFTVYIMRGTQVPFYYQEALAWASLVSYINGAINPFIYAYRCDSMGKEIRRFFGLRRDEHNVHPLETLQVNVPRN